MLDRFLCAAKLSKSGLLGLNVLLRWLVPFNAPHGIKITELKDESITVQLPFKRRNQNHVRGMHACALATAAEYATGVLLLSQIGGEHRLLMTSLQVEYLSQGRSDARIECALSKEWVDTTIRKPLADTGSATAVTEAKAFDADGKHLCTATVSWHFKKIA